MIVLFTVNIVSELETKPPPPSVNSVDCSVWTGKSLYLPGVFYIRSNPLPHTFYAICGLVLIYKGSISFCFIPMENFKGCHLLPKHFEMQGSEADWCLGTRHLPKALAPSFSVKCRHLASIGEAPAAMLLHSPVIPMGMA